VKFEFVTGKPWGSQDYVGLDVGGNPELVLDGGGLRKTKRKFGMISNSL
jgi:hypothetical protein